ncbi:hypothetical protein [Clostridium sp. YIM B02555]|uniref:hypothetical protein n=1 Tax=Clostridium sp. YIM B02555 TaxID=2911968 RepID=UPI001EED26E3|nr:hypothetical protein [Clostridium sp. YIM B02555]
MNFFTYDLIKGSSLNIWKYSELKSEPVVAPYCTMEGEINATEGYFEIDYPVRKDFLTRIPEVIPFNKNELFPNLYCGFESPRVDFSSFLNTPHWVHTSLFNNIDSNIDQTVSFSIITCGRVVIWVNAEQILDFSPYSRNHGSEIIAELPLKAGKNEVVVYLDDLAERDVNFFFEMKLLSEVQLTVKVPLDYEARELTENINFLESLYFKKDVYLEGNVIVNSDTAFDGKEVRISYGEQYFQSENEASGDITDFHREDQCLTVANGEILIGTVESIPTAGVTTVYVSVRMSNKDWLIKKLVCCIYNEGELHISLGTSIEERKQKALEIFSKLELMDMNSALAEFAVTKKLSEKAYEKIKPAIEMVKSKGDCADFMFSPLLAVTTKYHNELPDEFKAIMKECALDFRYWIDEPGNDVMWYFSENHSLLFHTCQYFAGYLYKESNFTAASRTGKEQYEIGKKRLEEWFDTFFAYGFSEWNSTTYLPIDLIGFFSLYLAAPDSDIKEMAKKALDFTFKVIAVNYHGRVLSSTFGRIYEHDIKAMRIGEISNVLAIAWNKGYFNNALRASTLFCMSDYVPPKEYINFIDLMEETAIEANYLQGINKVETYLYKTNAYSLAGAIKYNQYKKGHQQHMMNISLGNDATQLWINNPGEYAHSGENRPSYWAGNASCPSIVQYKNIQVLEYNIADNLIPKIHLYLPHWSLSEIQTKDKWLFIRKDNAYLGIFFSEGLTIENQGDTRGKEVYALGHKHRILVKCSSLEEAGSFNKFIDSLNKLEITDREIKLNDSQLGEIKYQDKDLFINDRKIERQKTYDIKPTIEKLLGKEGRK